ncbi:MAG: FkbM family methyltransferase [Synergistaceae bacterium]|nr:FkbM family methyltransferase [Synergistaceae bacterium]
MNTEKLSTKIYRKVRRLFEGLDTPWEFFLLCINCIVRIIVRKNFRLHVRSAERRMMRQHLKDGILIFREIRFPAIDPQLSSEASVKGIIEDTLFVYCKHDDCYEESEMESYYDLLSEGPYCFRNDLVDVTVEAGEVVLDAGSWIGDFAAYASVKNATTYAFEPSDTVYEYLQQTARLNKNIIPVKKGLGDTKITAEFTCDVGNSGSNRLAFGRRRPDGVMLLGEQLIEITTIDDFVCENSLTRVDFIKADIEGHERYMLKGALETLRRFAPKLAICTYHLPDDPEVLEKIIREANPKYNIVQKRKKLYASVPSKGWSPYVV